MNETCDSFIHRETLDRTLGKVEDTNCMISPGGYLPVHTMMPPTQSMNQSPTSTTMDHGDRFHPALMNPHFLTDTRRLKPESSHGGKSNLSYTSHSVIHSYKKTFS